MKENLMIRSRVIGWMYILIIVVFSISISLKLNLELYNNFYTLLGISWGMSTSQNAIRNVIPNSKRKIFLGYICETLVLLVSSSILGVTIALLKNVPIHQQQLLYALMEIFPIYLIFITIPPSIPIESGYKIALILAEFASYMFIFRSPMANMNRMVLSSIWMAVFLFVHYRFYNSWGYTGGLK